MEAVGRKVIRPLGYFPILDRIRQAIREFIGRFIGPKKKETLLTINLRSGGPTACDYTDYRTPGEWFLVLGLLQDAETGEGLGGKTLDFYENGVYLESLETVEDGYCGPTIKGRPAGTYVYRVEFKGDEEYAPSECEATVEVS